MDPGIICFEHCGLKIFCLKLPDKCPLCKLNFEVAKLNLLPFRVPYPFVRASQHPCAVVIKPTIGDFLNDYYNSMDLHIGVTTSSGIIVEFDQCGLRRHRSPVWEQCLLLGDVPISWIEHWDSTLLKICKQSVWTQQSYDEKTFNCYTFVLTFLKELQYGEMSKAASCRNVFCEQIIVPRTTVAGKYISLYRKLKNDECFVESFAKEVK